MKVNIYNTYDYSYPKSNLVFDWYEGKLMIHPIKLYSSRAFSTYCFFWLTQHTIIYV